MLVYLISIPTFSVVESRSNINIVKQLECRTDGNIVFDAIAPILYYI
jgi:hypothetical protein